MGTNTPRPAPAKDRAYEFVKERILDGGYPGGDLLSEGEVAEALGVSRTPVREAFLLLEAEGLMRLYPKRGALVVPVSPDEVHDVMETRMLVERHTADRLARRGAEPGAESVVADLQAIRGHALCRCSTQSRIAKDRVSAAPGRGRCRRPSDRDVLPEILILARHIAGDVDEDRAGRRSN